MVLAMASAGFQTRFLVRRPQFYFVVKYYFLVINLPLL